MKTKVGVLLFCFFHSFYGIQYLFSCILLYRFFCRLVWAILDRTPSQRFTRALICSLQMCPRTYVCQGSWPHPQIFMCGTSDLPQTLRFCLPLQMHILRAFLYLVRTLEGYSRSFSHPFRGLDLQYRLQLIHDTHHSIALTKVAQSLPLAGWSTFQASRMSHIQL